MLDIAQPYSHCHFCGAVYTTPDWPRACAACGKLTFRNPLPVAVALVPVFADGAERADGLLLVRRRLAPTGLALPGGFVDLTDASWQDATVRELREETGLRGVVPGRHHGTVSAPDSGTLLIFCQTTPVNESDLATARGSDETEGVAVARRGLGAGDGVVFDLHRDAIIRWFAEN